MNPPSSHQSLFKLCAPLAVGTILLTSNLLGDTKKHHHDDDDDDGPNLIQRVGNFLFKVHHKVESHLPPLPHIEIRPGSRNEPAPPREKLDDAPDFRQDRSVQPDNGSRSTPVQPPLRHLSLEEPQSTKQPSPNAEKRPPSSVNNPLPDKPESKRGSDANVTPEANAGAGKTQNSTGTNQNEILTAVRSNKPGRVKSPYSPFTELDVTGMAGGSLAKDPSTGRVFRVP